MTKQQRLERAQSKYPVGSRVFYWPGVRFGPGRVGTTIEPVSRQHGDGILWVRIEKQEGGTDYIALTHVKHWIEEPGRIVPPMTLDELEAMCDEAAAVSSVPATGTGGAT